VAKPVTIRILGDASGLTKALGVAESGLDRLGGAVSGMGRVAGAAIVGVGAVAAGGFVKGFTDAMGRDALQSVVGEDVLNSASAIYRDGWGESLEDVAGLVAEADRIFSDASDEQISQLAEHSMAIEQAYGIDSVEALQTASLLAEEFGISNARALDLIAESSSALSGPLRDENMAALNEYGGQFEKVGFSAEEFFSILEDNESAIVVDKLADSVKELFLNATDGSSATAATLEAVGLNYEEVTDKLLAGGPEARAATDSIVDGLLAIDDPLAQQIAMIELFGTAYEDTGLTAEEFLLKLDDIPDSMADATGSADELAGALGGNLLNKLESLKRKGFDKLAEVIQEHVLPAVTRLVDYGIANFPKWREAIMPVIDAVIDGVRMFADVLRGGESDDSFIAKLAVYLRDELWPLVMDIKDWFVENWPKISEVIATVVGFIVEEVLPRVIKAIRFVAEVVGEVIGYIVDHWPQISDAVQQVIDFVVDEVLPRIVSAFEWIKERVQDFIDVFQRFWSAWGDSILEAVQPIWDAIKMRIDGALQIITGVFHTFKALFEGDWSAMWDGIVEVLAGIWTTIKATFLLGWEGVKLSFEMVWETIKIMATAAFGRIVDGIKALPGLLLDGLKAGGQLLLDAGSWIGDKIMEGLVAALKFVGQTLWDMLPGPVQWGLEHGAGAVGGLISGVGGLFGVGGDDDPEYTMADYGNPDSPAYTMVGGGGYDYGSQARGGGTTNINVYTSTNAEPSDITNSVVWGMQVAGVPT
jgi:hypothetical protein